MTLNTLLNSFNSLYPMKHLLFHTKKKKKAISSPDLGPMTVEITFMFWFLIKIKADKVTHISFKKPHTVFQIIMI